MWRLIWDGVVLMAVLRLDTISAQNAAIPDCQTQMLDDCSLHNSSCDECIGFSPDCFWCTLLPSEVCGVTLNQCRNRSTPNAFQCPGTIQDPNGSVSVSLPVQNSPLTPQQVRMRLRRGKPQAFNLAVSTGGNPIDVYFLMDNSASLISDLETVTTLATELTSTLGSLTSDWRVGFGSFVDKPTLPWALSSYRRMSDPGCINNRATCQNPYSFRQHVPLTTNVDRFSEALFSINVSTNNDNPEGGLDALLQVAACPEIIGWRNNSVHMVVFLTDAGYHIAGDGKLGGIVRPNDGRCHMELNSDGSYEYTLGTVYDYPSIYQLSNVLTQQAIITLFAVSQSVLTTYETLSNTLPALAVVRDFTSANLVQIIEQNIRVLVNPVPETVPGLSVVVTPPTGDECNTVDGFSFCLARYNTVVSFSVTVTLQDCSILNATTETNIHITGVVGAQSTLTIIPVCECGCSREQEPSSVLCNDNGTLVCGICKCFEGRSGSTCQCDDSEKPEQCPTEIGEDGMQILCSGRGTCDECNQCICELEPVVNRTYVGTACNCSNACPVNDIVNSTFFGEVCSVPEIAAWCYCSAGGHHGIQADICEEVSLNEEMDEVVCGETRGTCRCDGLTCDCKTAPMSQQPYFNDPGQPMACVCDPDICYNPDNGEGLCVNIEGGEDGHCTCSGCLCPDGLVAHDSSCYPLMRVCQDNEACARCAKNASSAAICAQLQCDYTIVVMDEAIPSIYEVQCVFVDNQGCEHVFFVAPDEVSILVEVEESCPQPTNNLVWILPIVLIAIILLLGILGLIIAKLVLMFLDHLEYKRFEKQLEEVDWEPISNPLYVSPTRDYRNVLYRKQQPAAYNPMHMQLYNY